MKRSRFTEEQVNPDGADARYGFGRLTTGLRVPVDPQFEGRIQRGRLNGA